MKILKNLILALSASLVFLAPAMARSECNRYGMALNKEADGTYTIKSAKAYGPYIGDPYQLPDALVPYRPKMTAFDKASIENVVAEEIVYKKSVSGKDLPLLLYRSSQKKAPVVFFIHGGAWISGSYKSSASFCKTLAGKYGITAVSIEYTFAKESGARMEDTVNDCFDAVKYVLSRAKEFGIDPKRIGFVGGSAGGHLSALCAMHFPQTKAYAGWYGAYDLQYTMDVYAPGRNTSKRHRYDVYLNGWDQDYIDRFSPVKIAPSKKKMSFKARLFVGTADITAGPDNARRYYEALTEAGMKDVEVVTYENVTHAIGRSYAANDMNLKTMLLFSENL